MYVRAQKCAGQVSLRAAAVANLSSEVACRLFWSEDLLLKYGSY